MTPSCDQLSRDYQRIEQALRYLDANRARQPELGEVAKYIGLSEFHFQRVFSRWAGISPKRFLQFVTKEHAKELLRQTKNLLDVAHDAGLSGPGRLHDLFVQCEAVTPGEYKTLGRGLRIEYGFHPTPFGECLMATTARGICHMAFVQDSDRAAPIASLKHQWRGADVHENPAATRAKIDRVFNSTPTRARPLQLLLKGTNFQLKVWEALLAIPSGAVTSYCTVARYLDMPSAARAVGNAVAENPVAYIIPCHRVIRDLGDLGGYRWGAVRKKAILGWEAVHSEAARFPVV